MKRPCKRCGEKFEARWDSLGKLCGNCRLERRKNGLKTRVEGKMREIVE